MKTELTYSQRTITLHHGQDHIGRHISKQKQFYEHHILGYITRHCPLGGTWVDVGACIGTHTVFFAMFCADKVVAFEPAPANYTLLEKNITANGLTDKVVAVNVGISRDGRKVAILFNPDNYGNTSLVDDADGYETITPADAIDEPIAFLKIDCEEMSGEVLRAFLPVIRRDRPYILIEHHLPPPELMSIGYTVMEDFRQGTLTYLLRP